MFSFLNKLSEFGKHVGAFGVGVGNAWASNNLFGAGRGNPNDFGKYSTAAILGQRTADLLTLVQSGAEYVIGAGGEVLGFSLDATVVGAPAGAVLNVAGVAVWAHATGVGATALGNLLKAEGANNDVHSGAGGGNKDDLPEGFQETKEFGRQHGQKVYKKGNKYYSKDVGSGNGQGSHNGGVWKVFEKNGGKLKRIGTADNDLNIFKP